MLNWDDPLAVTRPTARSGSTAPVSGAPRPTPSHQAPTRWSVHDTSAHVRPGRGVVENEIIANRRGAQSGLTEQYPGATNPFPWMSEVIALKNEKNFFEIRVTEYRTGGALNRD